MGGFITQVGYGVDTVPFTPSMGTDCIASTMLGAGVTLGEMNKQRACDSVRKSTVNR